jgi:hypothetical protein
MGPQTGTVRESRVKAGRGLRVHHRPPAAPAPAPPPRRGSSGPICDTAKSTRPAMGSQYFCRKDFSTGGAAGRPVDASTAGAPVNAGLTRSARTLRVWVFGHAGDGVYEVLSKRFGRLGSARCQERFRESERHGVGAEAETGIAGCRTHPTSIRVRFQVRFRQERSRTRTRRRARPCVRTRARTST